MSRRHQGKTDAVCPCGQPASSGATICRDCVRDTRRRLGDQQAHYEQLTITLTRQARLETAPETGRSANRPLPYQVEASDLLAEQRKLLTNWCKACVRDLHTPEPAAYTARGLSMHIEHWLPEVRKHPRAGDLVVDLTDWCRRAIVCIDRQDRSYPIGPCPNQLEAGGWCPGKVIGFIPLSDPDSKRPAKIACDTCKVEWPGSQWSGLARLISKRTAA